MPRRSPEAWMARALELAAQGAGFTSPNPMVGAVLVGPNRSGGRLLAEGLHKKAGGPHAEVHALANASNAKGAHLYVTLEPCSHVGRTGPCADALIEAGIAEATVAMKDPNPKVAGKGIAKLRKAGVKVNVGLMRGEAQRLNEKYVKFIQTGLPFVTLKTAQTLDGKIADAQGKSRWITGPEARILVHRWRHEHDAVLVGVGTALADDPMLDCRTQRIAGRKPTQPARIIIDPRWRLPLDSKLVQTSDAQPTWVVGRADRNPMRRKRLEEAGARVLPIQPKPNGSLGWLAIFRKLGREGITSVLVEGGAKTAGSLLDARAADRLAIFVAPKLFADPNAMDAFAGPARSLSKIIRLDDLETTRVGEDWLMMGRVQGR